ncbi:MAG: 4Fe-4S dicluster domain-containing protein [Lentisphaerota bacterium]
MPARTISRLIVKSLFGEPATLMYPSKAREYSKNTRGRIAIKIEDCIFCGLCRKKCPTAAINVNKETKTWDIDRLKCITCNACVEACPKKCLAMQNKYSPSATVRQKDVFKLAVPVAKPGPVSGS